MVVAVARTTLVDVTVVVIVFETVPVIVDVKMSVIVDCVVDAVEVEVVTDVTVLLAGVTVPVRVVVDVTVGRKVNVADKVDVGTREMLLVEILVKQPVRDLVLTVPAAERKHAKANAATSKGLFMVTM